MNPIFTPADAQAVDLLRALVETPSVSGHERACAQRLVAAMTTLGLDAHVDASGSAVGIREGGGARDPDAIEIALLGHIDTVPGHIPVRIEDGRLYGRGSVDAKGSLAAFTVAAARVELPPGVRLRVIGAVEEETATSAGARHAAAAYRPSVCIIGEPSGADGVTIGYKGRLLADLQLVLSGSHSAGIGLCAPELAVNAWNHIRAGTAALRPHAARVFDQVQPRLRSITTTSDGLRDTVRMSLSFRLPPGVDAAACEGLCRAATADIPGDHTWTFPGHEVAVVADRSNSVVRALANSIRAGTRTPHIKVKTGTSDMNVVAPTWNCPIAAYGPGDSALDHTPDEHLPLDEYLRSIVVLTRAIESLARELLNNRPTRGTEEPLWAPRCESENLIA